MSIEEQRAREREVIAHLLECQARFIREGMVDGFDYRWRMGSGVLEGTNLIVPQTAPEFIPIDVVCCCYGDGGKN